MSDDAKIIIKEKFMNLQNGDDDSRPKLTSQNLNRIFFFITKKCSSYWRSANLKDLFLNLSTKVGNFQLVNSKAVMKPLFLQ